MTVSTTAAAARSMKGRKSEGFCMGCPFFNGMDGCPSIPYCAMGWMDLHWYFVETLKFLFACPVYSSLPTGMDCCQEDSNMQHGLDRLTRLKG
jgi:hypothetical protein